MSDSNTPVTAAPATPCCCTPAPQAKPAAAPSNPQAQPAATPAATPKAGKRGFKKH